MTITVGLDFDGLIGDMRNYHKGGTQYDAWMHAIGISHSNSAKPKWKDPIVARAFEEAHIDPGSPLYLKLIPGAREEICALLNHGFTLPVVTARSEKGAELASLWLAQQGIDLAFHATEKDRTKRHTLKRLGAIAHVDDTQSVLADLEHDLPYRFLFIHGQYALSTLLPGLRVVTSWRELGGALRMLAKALPA